MQAETAKGDVLQRIAGVSLIVGAIVTIVFNAVYPRPDDPSDVGGTLAKMADNEGLSQAAALGIAVGVWAFMIGVVGVYRSITSRSAAPWARLGFYGVVVGTTMFTVSQALYLAGVDVAEKWVAAGSGTGIPEYSAGVAINGASYTVFQMTSIVFWLALAFLGVGMVASSVYPRWLSWPPVILGAVVVVIGFIGVLSEPSRSLEVTFAIPAGLTSIWGLALGGWITRNQMKAM